MKTTRLVLSIILLTVLASCGGGEKKQSTDGIITVDVTASYPKKELILQDFMDVEYIPLETNDDFITMAYIQDIGKDVIVVRNRSRSSDGEIFFFDRKGESLRKINRQGQGAEEYTFLMQITLDEDNKEIFVNDHQMKRIFVYDLTGNYKRSFDHKEGTIYNPIYNFDQKNLICLDFLTDFPENSNDRFYIISKQDGSITKEIHIPKKDKRATVVEVSDETTGMIYVNSPRNPELIRYSDNWLLVDPSSDTIFSFQPNYRMTPFIIRTPSIQTMDQEVFLFPGVLTDHYYFMQSVKKEYDFRSNRGFPRTNLVYDKEQDALFEYVIHNDDFLDEEFNLVNDVTLINNNEIAFMRKIDAFELVEAYEKGKLKGKLKEIAAELDEESNPVIMLAKHIK